MQKFCVSSIYGKSLSRRRWPLLGMLLPFVFGGVMGATEGGTSVYPAGVETIMPGMMPPAGKTIVLEFNNF